MLCAKNNPFCDDKTIAEGESYILILREKL